jgi:LacI family transcriptional regulator
MSEESGYEEMKKLLQLTPRPDGVFCQNDPTAMGVMRAIVDAGLRIPDDIAVVGCGNLRYADFLRVSLTSIDQQSELIGDNAAKLALALIEKKGDERPRTILLEPKLIVRGSSSKHLNGNGPSIHV